MTRLLVAFPLYKQVSATFFSNWLFMDQTAVAGCLVVKGVELVMSMGLLVEQALEREGWDRFVVFEEDMSVPPWALLRMANYRPEQAIVGSMYFRHDRPHNANVLIEPQEGTLAAIAPQTVKDWCAHPGLYQVDAVGFGLIGIARHVLENWDPTVPMFSIDAPYNCHDGWFCHYARQQGHHIFVDSGLVCGHLTEVEIDLADNQRHADMTAEVPLSEFSY